MTDSISVKHETADTLIALACPLPNVSIKQEAAETLVALSTQRKPSSPTHGGTMDTELHTHRKPDSPTTDTEPMEWDERAFRVFCQRRLAHGQHRGRNYILRRAREDWKSLASVAKHPHFVAAFNAKKHNMDAPAHAPVHRSMAPDDPDKVYLARSRCKGRKRKRDLPTDDEETETASSDDSNGPVAGFSLRLTLAQLESDSDTEDVSMAPSWSILGKPLPPKANQLLTAALPTERGIYMDTHMGNEWSVAPVLSNSFPSRYAFRHDPWKKIVHDKKKGWLWLDPFLTGCSIRLWNGDRRPLRRPTGSVPLLRPLTVGSLRTVHVPRAWAFANEHEKHRTLQCPLDLDSAEAFNVLALFHMSCSSLEWKVRSVFRIQDVGLWDTFQSTTWWARERKRGIPLDPRLTTGAPGQTHVLFHGTTHDSSIAICGTGFNRALGGKNGRALGNGTYFAWDAEVSANNVYSPPEGKAKTKCMLVCQVMTGLSALGERNMTAPPPLQINRLERHDSTVDCLERPRICSIFSDHQAYPLYSISFCSVPSH